ncbi:MAG: tetratricopeptide repeat protein [Polyangiales bacterium]
MRRLLVRFGASLLLGALLAGGGTASARVDADPAVVERLVQYGHMNQASARRIIELVNRGLIENAARGGFKYDRVRERVGRTMFNGPGTTREEYQQRLRYVVGRMRSGLDVALLETLFPSARGSAVECVTDFPVTLPACDALLAAATKRSAALPYTPPDDGNALEQELSRAGASKKVAGDVTVALSSVMLEVGRTLDHDPRRQELLGLLAACPGAVKNREAQVRAWNLGPTVNMSRCIATELARRGGSATIATQILFGMEKDAAQSFLLWGSPAMASQIAAASGGPGVSVDNVLKVARSHYQAGRFLQAAQAYEQAARMDPSSSRALAGVGSASLRGGDASKAVEALKAAVQLSPRNANLYAMLAEGYVAAGAFPQAANAYKQALAIDKNHAQAKSGFARLTTDRNLAEAKSLRSKARQHFMARQFKISLTLYEKAVKLEPTNPAGYAGLGASKLALKDSAGSVAAYKKATDLNPKNSAHWT